MSGMSAREKAAEQLYKEADLLPKGIKNRWETFTPDFNYDKMASNLEKIFGNYEDIISRDYIDRIAEQQSKAGRSLASRGITGGSILTDTQSKIASDINKSKANVLANLAVNKAKNLGDLMEYFNRLGLIKTQNATNTDMFNLNALLNRYRLKAGAIGGLSDDTWLDDLLAGLQTGGNVAQGLAALKLASTLTAGSDIRLKENIEKIGEINGINIYRFNYKGDNRKFIGVIAQEVEHIPGAVREIGGYKFVNYKVIGIPFIEEV